MFKDRRGLMERDMIKMKQACGEMYFNIIMKTASEHDLIIYESMKGKLEDMITDISIIDQLIADGHK